jgi:hypothetical protein
VLPITLSTNPLHQATELCYFEELWPAQQELYKTFAQSAMVGVGVVC